MATPASADTAQSSRPGLVWRQDEGSDANRNNQAVMRAIGGWVRAGDKDRVTGLLAEWPPEDVLDCVAHIRTKDALKIMEWLPDDIGIAVLSELNPEYRRVLFKPTTQSKFSKLISRMKPKAARRLLLELPPEFASQLLEGRTDADELLASIRHGHESAAAAMQHRSLVIPCHWTLGQLIDVITARERQIDKIDALMVVDEDGTLRGYLRVRDLLMHPRDTVVEDVMRTDVLAVATHTDREDVLELARKEGKRILAVINAQGQLVGSITPDELADIERLEAREDLLRMGGVSPDSSLFDSPFQIVRKRAPWLLIGLVGALLAAFVIAGYEETLAEAAILASFIPVIMATAGNVGIQASTVSIQALTTDADESDAVWERLLRELAGSALNGALVGAMTAAVVMIAAPLAGVDQSVTLAATAFVSLLVVIILTGCIGAIVPIILDRLGLDPSVSTGIFIVTSADVFGVLTFFVTAQLLYL